MQGQAVQFLQSLRGAQATVFLAYLLVRHAMTVRELCDTTGLSDDAIRTGVRGLEAKELLFKQVGEHGRISWVLRGETFFGLSLESQNPEKPDSVSSCSSSSRGEFLSLPSEEEQEQEELLPESGKTGSCIRDCLKVCDELGIREPKRSIISQMRHVTPDLIRAHVKQACDEGRALGTAIYRLQYGWSLDPDHAMVVIKRPARYSEGEFGQLFAHPIGYTTEDKS